MRLDPSRQECLRAMPCMTPLSSIPERLRCRAGLQAVASRHGETRAPSVGSLPGSTMLDTGGYCRSPECEKPVPDESPDHAGIRRVLRRGRSFCLRVCGCAPSAARPAKNMRPARSPDACGECTRGPQACQMKASESGAAARCVRLAPKKSAGNDPRAGAFTADCSERLIRR